LRFEIRTVEASSALEARLHAKANRPTLSTSARRISAVVSAPTPGSAERPALGGPAPAPAPGISPAT
jgi:hypothetical protein